MVEALGVPSRILILCRSSRACYLEAVLIDMFVQCGAELRSMTDPVFGVALLSEINIDRSDGFLP